jgi:small-conductance mechanosensitive channel
LEKLLNELEMILTDILGEAMLAQVASKAILIVGAFFFFWLLWKIVDRLCRTLEGRVDGWKVSWIKGLSIQRQRILTARDISRMLQGAVRWFRWLLKAALILSFINVVFYFFEGSRSLALTLLLGVGSVLKGLVVSFVDYLPNLAVIAVVLLVVRFLIHILKLIFRGIEQKRITLPGFYPEWSATSFNLTRILMIVLTLIIIFPYLPGSDSPAFQGVSIFVGVLFSLGSTTAVANVVAGIVITYTRAFKMGDRVKISNTEGDVIERSAFVTRIRTPKNVEVSIPNSSVLGDHIINYSSQAETTGLTLHTNMTIGYDVPWTTVHELLLEAASKTDDILSEPPPFVLQTALNDFYVEYELNATTRNPGQKTRIYSDLHANILNAFQAAEVEILSPHYRADRDGTGRVIPGGTK